MPLDKDEIQRIARASADEISSRIQHSKDPSPRVIPIETHTIAPYFNEQKTLGDKIIDKYSIIGTKITVFSAWEPSGIMGPHGTITTFNNKWYGRIGTRRIPPEISNLSPGSPQRFEAVGKFFEEQYDEAYELIVQAFPEAEEGTRSMGEIETVWKTK